MGYGTGHGSVCCSFRCARNTKMPAVVCASTVQPFSYVWVKDKQVTARSRYSPNMIV